MSESRLARIGRDQLSTWLPALMMMLFALGTWWLVRSAPKFPTDGAAAVVSKEPDYFMNQFRVRDFDATGRLTSDLTGVEGHHFPATDTLEVKDPHTKEWKQIAKSPSESNIDSSIDLCKFSGT